MGVFTSPVALMQRQRARFAGVKMTMEKAHFILAHDGFSDFKEQTTGTLGKKEKRLLGHPYARGPRILNVAKLGGFKGVQDGKVTQITAKGRVRDLPINMESGRLHATITLLSKSNGRIYDLFSSVPYAKFALAVEGTRYVRPRGLLGPRGLLRKLHKARHAGIVLAVRQSQGKP